jgi:hypothetical protein
MSDSSCSFSQKRCRLFRDTNVQYCLNCVHGGSVGELLTRPADTGRVVAMCARN